MDSYRMLRQENRTYGSTSDFIVDFWNEGENTYNSMGFQKISNVQAKIEYDVVQEGGNPTPVLLPIPNKQPDIITFERGTVLNGIDYWDCLSPGMMVKNVCIYVRKYGTTVRKLEFEQGIVISKEYPMLNAMEDGIYILKLEIAHSGIQESWAPYSG